AKSTAKSSGPRRPAHRAAPAAPAPAAARKSAAVQSPAPARSAAPAKSPAPVKSPAPAGATAPSAVAAAADRPAPPVHGQPSSNGQPPPGGRKKRRRAGFRVFGGLGAALSAVAPGLAYGSLGSSSARLSGADTRFVPGTEAPAQAGTGRPVPQPDSSP